MYLIACLCSVLATAISIYVTEAILKRRRAGFLSENREVCAGNCQLPELPELVQKCFVSEGVQVPDSDGLNSLELKDSPDHSPAFILASQTEGNINYNSSHPSDEMGELDDNFAKMSFSAGEFKDSTQVEQSVQTNCNINQQEYYINPNMDYNEVFFSELSAKDQQENDVIADNNKNHEAENIRPVPKQRTRRMSDVIDCLGESFTMEKAGSRKSSSSSSPPPTPCSDAGYSSVHSTPSHTKVYKKVARQLADTTDSGVNVKPTYASDEETTDAGPINSQLEEMEDMVIRGPTSDAVMPVDKDAEEYNMNHPRRGRAVVFNNDTFDNPDVKDRDGSEADVKNLNNLFSALDFEITIHHNKDYNQIKKILDDLSQEDHSDADCIVVTVLTHGMNRGYLYSKDVPYPVEYLWKPFTADKCKTLAGKPKIFIVQACRGDSLDPGVRLVRSRTQTDSAAESYKIPTYADFLIAYSSAEGFYSWRNPESGTWFIQCLCKELIENAATSDLLKILTRTARRVAVEYESSNDAVWWQDAKKQVPSVTSMLIRDVYFRSKKS